MAERIERKAQERTVSKGEREACAKKYVKQATKDLERELHVLKTEEKVRNQKLDDLQSSSTTTTPSRRTCSTTKATVKKQTQPC